MPNKERLVLWWKKLNSSKLVKSVWFFPFVLLCCLIVLTAFRISGTSVGTYHLYFFGAEKADPDLLYGSPRSIRSDEWLGNTQMIIAQEAAGYPRVNENIGSERDMSLIVDVPYKEWSVLFKPQNLAFFVLPLEFAFAFKWWLLLVLLMTGCYFFALRILPGKRLVASLVALTVGFSPFVFWWYQTITIAPLFYGFFILLLGIRILRNEPVKLGRTELSPVASYILYSLALGYILVAFGLIIYPPFQVPIAVTVGLFLVGYWLQLYRTEKIASLKELLRRTSILVVAAVLAACVGLTFVKTRSHVIETIQNSAYPGKRIVAPGDFNPAHLVDTFAQPQLQRTQNANQYYNNQSEAANFILLLPFLLLPGVFLTVYEYRKRKRLDWAFVSIQVCAGIFLANLFIPWGQLFYRITLLELVPHQRLLIGIGFVGILHMLYVMKKAELVHLSKQTALRRIVYAYGALCIAGLLVVAAYTHYRWPLFIPSWPFLIGLTLTFAIIVLLFLLKRFVPALLLMLAFSLFSVFHIHPLYQGLGPLANTKLITTMTTLSKPDDNWASVDDFYMENFGIVAGVESVTGMQFYPDVDFWKQVQGESADIVYNRFARILFVTTPREAPLTLAGADGFYVQLTCSEFVQAEVDYFLANQPLQAPCLEEVKQIPYPARTFYIYRVLE